MRSMGHIDDLRCLYISLVEEAVSTLDIGEFREGCWDKEASLPSMTKSASRSALLTSLHRDFTLPSGMKM